jgi:hypothetical protein
LRRATAAIPGACATTPVKPRILTPGAALRPGRRRGGRAGRCSRAKADADSEAAAGLGLRGHHSVVGVGDCLDDREAEAETAGGGPGPRVESLKRLEETSQLLGRDQLAGVGDNQDSTPWLGAGCDFDPAAGEVVPDRVRDEGGDEPLQEARVAGRGCRVLPARGRLRRRTRSVGSLAFPCNSRRCGREDSNLQGPRGPAGPKPAASTSSATPANARTG